MSESEQASVDIMQQTLSGGEQLIQDIEEIRGRPDTFVECPECGEEVLRSRQFDHEHEIFWAEPESNGGGGGDDGDDGDDDDDPERVGSWYDIELSYSVTYRFRAPAWSEHQAEDIAKDWQLDARPADSHHVHTDRREVKEITTEDVPDDYDPYGNTRLWEVFEDDE